MNAKISIRSILIALLAFTQLETGAQSQTAPTKSKGIAIALTAGHYGYDGAVGIEISSPPIFFNALRLRVRMNHTWFEQYKAISDDWVTFNTYWAGLVYNTRVIDRARFFFEAGSYNVSPNVIFASKKIHTGYYGSLGIELFARPNNKENFCYFFSGGFASVNAHADKLEGNPHYGNGFTFTNGFRYYF